MIPDFLSRPDVVRKVLIRGMMEESGLGCHVKKEAEGSRVWKRSYYSKSCDDGEKSHEQLLEAGKDTKQQDSLLEGFPGGAVDKTPPANAGDSGLIPDPGRSQVLQWNEAHVPQVLNPCASTTETRAPRAHAL